MTTTNRTAATWRASLPVPFAVSTMILGLALGGCESASNLLSGANQPAVAVVDTPVAKTTSVAIAPVLGVPEATSKQIVAQLSSGLDKTKFTIVTQPATPADFTLRGYATAAKDTTTKDKGAAKLSYFFDVMDNAGKKVNRIAGEEKLASAPAGKDIWNAVTPEISQAVATKTATSFAASIPNGAGLAIASAAGTPPPSGLAAPAVPGTVKAAASPADVAAATSPSIAPQTGSIDKAATVTALVPSVTGAPGDGSQALSAALQKELTRNGVALSDAAGTQAYRVEGKVSVGPDKDGKQPIEISWNVKDPQGKKLGTVTQKNEIPQGSLDGAWGKTADAAAAAAAQGIIKLLPGQKTTQQ